LQFPGILASLANGQFVGPPPTQSRRAGQENHMRRVLILTLFTLVWAIPASTQDAATAQNSQPDAAQVQSDATQAQSKDTQAQSKDTQAQSKEDQAGGKEDQAQSKETRAASEETQARIKDNSQDQNVLSTVQSIRSDLEREGLTDIELIPSSFVVRAKDQNGNSIMLVVGTDPFGDE
jgi:hypothetical protein